MKIHIVPMAQANSTPKIMEVADFVSGSTANMRMGMDCIHYTVIQRDISECLRNWLKITFSKLHLIDQSPYLHLHAQEWWFLIPKAWDILTSETSVWPMNESYIVGTNEYVWYITIIHRTLHIHYKQCMWTVNYQNLQHRYKNIHRTT